jgi:cytochrome c
MHFSFLEKFGLSVLICAWLVFGSIMLGRIFVSVDEPDALAYALPEGAGHNEAAEEAVEEAEPEVDFAVLMAEADPSSGERVFNKCKACHNVEPGGANKVGPNLWNVVGRGKGLEPGFSYSSALAELGGLWTFENLSAFLEAPKEYAPGNKMTFGGLSKPTERAAVIAYLNQNADSPLPIEAPVAEEPADAEAPEGEAAAGDDAQMSEETGSGDSEGSAPTE